MALHGAHTPRSRFPLFSIQSCDVSFDVLTPLVLGDVANAERMIRANLKHLLTKGFATGFCGKTIGPVTPLQLAVCVGDTDFLPVIEAGFARLPDGFAEKHKQLKEILHRSLDFYLKKYEAEMVRLYELKGSLPDDDTQHAEIDNKLAYLQKALDLYVAEFNTWNPAPHNTWEKCDLFWRQLIGFIQRFFPANLAQAFAQGIYYIVEDKETVRRSFNFRHNPAHSFFPLSDSLTGSRFNYVAEGGLGVAWWPVKWPRPSIVFSKLMSSKNNQAWRTYAAHASISCGALVPNSVMR